MNARENVPFVCCWVSFRFVNEFRHFWAGRVCACDGSCVSAAQKSLLQCTASVWERSGEGARMARGRPSAEGGIPHAPPRVAWGVPPHPKGCFAHEPTPYPISWWSDWARHTARQVISLPTRCVGMFGSHSPHFFSSTTYAHHRGWAAAAAATTAAHSHWPTSHTYTHTCTWSLWEKQPTKKRKTDLYRMLNLQWALIMDAEGWCASCSPSPSRWSQLIICKLSYWGTFRMHDTRCPFCDFPFYLFIFTSRYLNWNHPI